MTYSWDGNPLARAGGNLLGDGVNTYGYDAANRLTSFSGAALNASFAYNGLGDRLQETVDGVPIDYALDLNSGLTQVLSDGTSTYLYGLDRLSQSAAADEYFLGDALGSVTGNGVEASLRLRIPGKLGASYGLTVAGFAAPLATTSLLLQSAAVANDRNAFGLPTLDVNLHFRFP